jgi:hypothetical protein
MASSPAERQRRRRDRRSEGIRVIPVEVSIDVAEVLIELDFLEVGELHNTDAVAKALEEFIADQAQSVTRDNLFILEW